jgi:hypothetical protein
MGRCRTGKGDLKGHAGVYALPHVHKGFGVFTYKGFSVLLD